MNMTNIKQLYTNQNSSRWKKVNKMRHFTVTGDLKVAQKKNKQGDWAFFCLFYSSICQLYNCGFIMGFVILAIYFPLKTIIFNVNT